ncbi:MAG: hypothetical protein ACI4XP_05360 [Acutalibacteraceae bacterium]
MNCRGKNRRIQIVSEYDIIPIAHMKLLNGKTIPSDAGGDITDTYYIFKCTNKQSGEEEIIYCGTPTAKELCKMIGKKPPILFNPLKSDCISSHNVDAFENNKPDSNAQKWNPTRKQLYNATMLIISDWDAKPNTPLFFIKSELETHIDTEPALKLIKSINTILKNSRNTIRKIISKLEKNNDLKEFKFDLIVEKLQKLHIEQFFE